MLDPIRRLVAWKLRKAQTCSWGAIALPDWLVVAENLREDSRRNYLMKVRVAGKTV
jgi:hypothetical protein